MGPITSDLLALFPDTVTVEPYLSEDRFGKASYGAAFDCPARVIGRTRMTMDTDGQERSSNVQAVLAGSFGVTPQDRYTLPERFSINPLDTSDITHRQPTAIAVDKETDENGPHHETVYFSPSPRLRGF
jgi:hypothetical protein